MIMVWAFAASWLIKGEYLLKDKEELSGANKHA